MAGVIPTTGNTNNDIQVADGSSARTGTWRKFTDLDYIVTGSVTVEAGGGLTLEPGLNLMFDPNRGFDIYGVLTAVGAPSPNLYVAEEISGGRFRIAGGAADGKVCWRVSGVRTDAAAKSVGPLGVAPKAPNPELP